MLRILGLEEVEAQIGTQESLLAKTDVWVDQELVEEGEASVESDVTKESQTCRVEETVPTDELVKLGHALISESSCHIQGAVDRDLGPQIQLPRQANAVEGYEEEKEKATVPGTSFVGNPRCLGFFRLHCARLWSAQM